MSRTNEGQDALRSSEAHPQARSIAPPWPERSQGRVPIGRHRPKSAETGETHPLPGAGLRPVRRKRRLLGKAKEFASAEVVGERRELAPLDWHEEHDPRTFCRRLPKRSMPFKG